MATATDQNARRVQFDPNGEGLDFADMKNMQAFAQARNWAALFTHALANGAGDPNDPGGVEHAESFTYYNELSMYGGAVIALHPGSAYVSSNNVANQLCIQAGSLAMVIDEPFNTGEDFAIFRFNAGPSAALATAVGHATLPRIDIVEVKLEWIDGSPEDRSFEDATTREPTTTSTNKEKQLQLTYQIKAGTPAATPAYPAPSAGFTAMAAVYVAALHNGLHAAADIRDLRMPVGVRCIDVDLKGFHFTGVNPWTPTGMIAYAAAASDQDADRVIVPCPIATKSARLLAVGVMGFADTPRCEIGRIDYPTAGGAVTFTKYGNLMNVSGDMLANKMVTCDGVTLADEIAGTAVIKGDRAVGTRVGTALWCNGYAGGMAHVGNSTNDGGEAPISKLAISFGGTTGSKVGLVRFWIAEGL